MSLTSALAAGRFRHSALIAETGDECVIARSTEGALDPATDTYSASTTPVYTGACRVKQFRTGRPRESGQVAVMQRGYDVQIPWDAPGAVERGDVVTITASADLWLVGRELIVAEVNYSGTQTARHILAQDRS